MVLMHITFATMQISTIQTIAYMLQFFNAVIVTHLNLFVYVIFGN